MIITCSNCSTCFSLNNDLVKEKGSKVECPQCKYAFMAFPSFLQNESEVHRKQVQESKETMNSQSFSSSYLQPDEEDIFQNSDSDIDWDLSEIEKILQVENIGNFDGATPESDKQPEDFDDFEFGDLDDLFELEEKAEFVKPEDIEKTEEVEDIDLSELEDLFMEDEIKFPQASVSIQDLDKAIDFEEEFDLSDLEKIIEFEEESGTDMKALKSKIESENEYEDHEIEFDFALEPDLDEGKTIELVFEEEEPLLVASEKSVESEPHYTGNIEGFQFKFNADENPDKADLLKKEDYNLEGTRGEFIENFGKAVLADKVFRDEINDDNQDSEYQETKPKTRFGKMVMLSIVFVLLAISGYGVFNYLNTGNFQIPIMGSYTKTEIPEPGNLKMIVSDLNSMFEHNQHAGKIFIITGSIKNEYSEPRSFIKVTGKLYETNKKLSHTEQVYAGNFFSELELRSLEMESIKSRLNNRVGQNSSNVNIGPGQSVPFMIVFSVLPQNLEEFTVEIDSSSPA